MQMKGITSRPLLFELFVSKGFCSFEASSVTHVLRVANEIACAQLFAWRYVSDTPGMIVGGDDVLVRAEPAILDHDPADVMVVVGGTTDA